MGASPGHIHVTIVSIIPAAIHQSYPYRFGVFWFPSRDLHVAICLTCIIIAVVPCTPRGTRVDATIINIIVIIAVVPCAPRGTRVGAITIIAIIAVVPCTPRR